MKTANDVILEGVFPPRRESAELVVALFKEIDGHTIVETGCFRGNRGDGASTLLYGCLANESGGTLTSIDINCEHVELAKAEVAAHGLSNVTFVLGDSVEALREFSGRIDLLYLDSLDYSDEHPEPSQLHNLAEFCSAVSKMSDRSIVVMDDADFPSGGKPKITRVAIEAMGWVNRHDGYQLVYTNFK